MPVQNGSVVLLEVDVDGMPTYTVMAAQRDLSVSEATEPIDFSTKDSRNMIVQGGRYSSEVTMDAAYVPGDAAYDALETAMRSGAVIKIQIGRAHV